MIRFTLVVYCAMHFVASCGQGDSFESPFKTEEVSDSEPPNPNASSGPNERTEKYEGDQTDDAATQAEVYDTYEGVDAGSPDDIGPNSGNVKFMLADAPAAYNATKLMLHFKAIEFHIGDVYYTFPLNLGPIDLLQYQNGQSLDMGTFSVQVGTYDSVRLILDKHPILEFEGGATKNAPLENTNNSPDRAYGYFVSSKPGTVQAERSQNWLMHVNVWQAISKMDGNYKLAAAHRVFTPEAVGSVTGIVTSELYSWVCVYQHGKTSDDNGQQFCSNAQSVAKINDKKFTSPFLEPGLYNLHFYTSAGVSTLLEKTVTIERSSIADLGQIDFPLLP